MKKLLVLLVVGLSCISCSNEENANATAPFLQKLITSHNTPAEKIWNFNAQGQLTSVTNAQGQTLETFGYDSMNNVVSYNQYTNGTTTASYQFTYNTNQVVTKINDIPVNFNTTTQTYSVVLNGITKHVQLNNNLIATAVQEQSTLNGTVSYSMMYENGNMTSYSKTSGTTVETKNFEYQTTTAAYKTELLKLMLPVLRVKSFVDIDFFNYGFASDYVATTIDNGNPAQLRYNVGLTPGDRLLEFACEKFENGNLSTVEMYQQYYYSN